MAKQIPVFELKKSGYYPILELLRYNFLWKNHMDPVWPSAFLEYFLLSFLDSGFSFRMKHMDRAQDIGLSVRIRTGENCYDSEKD